MTETNEAAAHQAHQAEPARSAARAILAARINANGPATGASFADSSELYPQV